MSSLLRIDEMVFVAFNRQVAALDRESGRIVWSWKADRGSGFVSTLLDGDRLIVSIQGYTYCLDPLTGRQRWFQEFKGYGLGITSLTSVRGSSCPVAAGAAQRQDEEQASASHTHTHVAGA